jgi:hypothetical protein
MTQIRLLASDCSSEPSTQQIIGRYPYAHDTFTPGEINISTRAFELLGDVDTVTHLLRDHLDGRWGDIPADCWESNQRARARQRGMIYDVQDVNNQRLLLATVVGRSTTIMLSQEY